MDQGTCKCGYVIQRGLIHKLCPGNETQWIDQAFMQTAFLKKRSFNDRFVYLPDSKYCDHFSASLHEAVMAILDPQMQKQELILH